MQLWPLFLRLIQQKTSIRQSAPRRKREISRAR
jgi:hypothetical protein